MKDSLTAWSASWPTLAQKKKKKKSLEQSNPEHSLIKWTSLLGMTWAETILFVDQTWAEIGFCFFSVNRQNKYFKVELKWFQNSNDPGHNQNFVYTICINLKK